MARNVNDKRSEKSNAPAYNVYAVSDKGNGKSIWTLIGAAFAHEDDKGFNISDLNVIPAPGARIVLRVREEEAAN